MPSALYLVPCRCRPAPMVQAGAVSSSTAWDVVGAVAVLIATTTVGAMALAKHKVIGALLGSIAGLIGLGFYEAAHAAAPPKPAPGPTLCPDGTPAPGGDTAGCASPRMGYNDPDAPPGGWAYSAPVSQLSAVQQAANALAAVNPCLKSSEPLVRAFQAAAGLAQLNASPGWDRVSPPGTDGRYGGDVAIALARYVPKAPPPCYSNAGGVRPSWWGAPGTYLNAG